MHGPSGYGLGLPLWGQKNWLGSFYTPDAPASQYLSQYASVFNAVEGNTTFYASPAPTTVSRWAEQVPEGFRFCFKLPRAITHDRMLRHCEPALSDFLRLFEPLAGRLGPFLIQLPAGFGPRDLPALGAFLSQLPVDLRFAVELRHPALFRAAARGPLEEMLREAGVGNVSLDSRPMRSGDMLHPAVQAAAHKKPDLPVFPAVTAGSPVVRLIFHPEGDTNAPWLAQWAALIAGWIRSELNPLVFVHCPDNGYSPGIAAALHAQIAMRVAQPSLAPFPADVAPAASTTQIDLF